MAFPFAGALALTLVATAAVEAEKPEFAAFQAGIAASSKRLVPAVFAYAACQGVHKDRRVGEAEIGRQHEEAVEEFRKQVVAHWPYGDERLKEQEAARAALKEIHSLFSRAKGGEPPPIERDEAIRRILELGERFPDSPVSDEAHFFAAHLQWDVKPRRREEFFKLIRKVDESTGPLNAYRILALTNLASESKAADRRLQDRQRFSACMRELHDYRVLSERLFTNPLPTESPASYVKRITATLINIERHYAVNTVNMTVDAMLTGQPQERIAQIRQSEAENPYLEREMRRRGLHEPLTRTDSSASARLWAVAISSGLLLVLLAGLLIKRRLVHGSQRPVSNEP